MSKKKRKNSKPDKEVEIINRRTRKIRKIHLNEKQIIIYNDTLNEFQLLPVVSASYDEGEQLQDE